MRIPHQSVFVVTKLGQDQSSRGTELISGWLFGRLGHCSPLVLTRSLPLSLILSLSLIALMNQITEIFKLIIYPIDREHQHSSSCTTTDVASRLLNTLARHPLHLKYRCTSTPTITLVWWYASGAVGRPQYKGKLTPFTFQLCNIFLQGAALAEQVKLPAIVVSCDLVT
jgi:hypothetical protein